MKRFHKNFLIVGFNPLALRALPLYSLMETPRNATGHGRGRGLEVVFQFRYKDSIVHFSPVRMVASHPAMLRGTAGEVFKVALYLFLLRLN